MLRRFVPPLSALSAFEAASRLGSFSQAARELNLTQGAISRQISLLEDLVGRPLFERRHQRVYLTPAGTFYAEQVRDVLTRLSTATGEVITMGNSGELKLGVLPSFGTHWLIPRMGSFFEANRDITISFASWIKPASSSLDQLDAAIHFCSDVWPGVAFDTFMSEDVIPVATPRLRDELNLRAPADLKRAMLLVQETRPSLWPNYIAFAKLDMSIVQSSMSFSHFAMVVQAALAGIGVAIAPTLLMEKELASGQLVQLFDATLRSKESYKLIYRESRRDYQPLAAFRNWLLAEIKVENDDR